MPKLFQKTLVVVSEVAETPLRPHCHHICHHPLILSPKPHAPAVSIALALVFIEQCREIVELTNITRNNLTKRELVFS